MSGMFVFLRPAQLFRPALRLLRFGPLFQHLLAGSELFPPRQDPLFITPLSEPSQPVGRQHDRDIPDRLSRAVTPDLRPQIPLERPDGQYLVFQPGKQGEHHQQHGRIEPFVARPSEPAPPQEESQQVDAQHGGNKHPGRKQRHPGTEQDDIKARHGGQDELRGKQPYFHSFGFHRDTEIGAPSDTAHRI